MGFVSIASGAAPRPIMVLSAVKDVVMPDVRSGRLPNIPERPPKLKIVENMKGVPENEEVSFQIGCYGERSGA